MRVLVLNGSSRSRFDSHNANNTEKLTEAFLQGVKRHIFFSTGRKTIDIEKANIEPCTGCNSCWQSTPGKCNIVGDVQSLKQKFLHADTVIWSLPLYYYGPPSVLKAFVDVEPRLASRPKKKGLFDRTKKSQKHVLICACGFDSQINYDSYFKQFDTMYDGRNVKLLCSQGELLSVPQMQKKTDDYLESVRKAGVEFASAGKFSAETEKILAMPIYNTN